MDTVYNFHEMIDIIDVICTLRTELHPINGAAAIEDRLDGPVEFAPPLPSPKPPNGICDKSESSKNIIQCKIENMPDHDLKALLEEAITYKCPKDREHKSAAFNVSEPNFKNSHFQLKFTYQRVKNAKQKSIITKLSVLRENLLRHKKRRNSERKQISSRSGKIMYGRDGWGS
ncbi:uncharacterized protein LOC129757345 isoform X2 [Uranotaenia lowii]|uniref:uncharacterized protein LOC129757345 isoform X2 n=1 Tax=Uranotaenia lowii TaxID=190385 RepID=UPI002478D36B|nr:uncharacterized protein LOC129757345 isoform X2 [Uranotaenia lowii]